MIPMTPSGARTRSTRRPLGRTHPSTTSPTGSARAATLRRPSAMPCNRPSTRRRSREVASAPDSSARRTSVALASRIRSACTPSRSAARSRASSRAAEDDRDSTRLAATVRRARSIIAGEGVDVTVSAYFPGFAPRRAEREPRSLGPGGGTVGARSPERACAHHRGLGLREALPGPRVAGRWTWCSNSSTGTAVDRWSPPEAPRAGPTRRRSPGTPDRTGRPDGRAASDTNHKLSYGKGRRRRTLACLFRPTAQIIGYGRYLLSQAIASSR